MAEENPYKLLEALETSEREKKELQNKNTEYQSFISNSSFNNAEEGNQRQWQLEVEDVLDKIEHFLKGDAIVTDAEGNTFYQEQKDKDLVILNKYGVNSVMQILGNYVNRNHMLSFYDEDRINEIMSDIGDELAKFIFCNYEKMGMDTEFKKSRYILLVMSILHIIESTYRRALRGETARLNNTDIKILQTDNMGLNKMQQPQIPIKKKWNPLKPSTW